MTTWHQVLGHLACHMAGYMRRHPACGAGEEGGGGGGGGWLAHPPSF